MTLWDTPQGEWLAGSIEVAVDLEEFDHQIAELERRIEGLRGQHPSGVWTLGALGEASAADYELAKLLDLRTKMKGGK